MKGKLAVIGVCLTIMTVAFVGTVNNVKAIAALREENEEKIVEPEVVIAEVESEQVYYDVPLSERVQDTIFAECEKHGISPAIVFAQIKEESEYNTYAIGDDGRSAGLMQIQAKWNLQRMIDLNCTDLFDPCENVTVGIDYLAYQLDRYNGNMAKALTAYNRGNYNGTITEYAKTILANAEMVGERK